MTVGTHTSGHWVREGEWIYANQNDGVRRAVASCDVGSKPVQERIANARLICAAPDLLAVCAAWIRHHDDEESELTFDEVGSILKGMRIAIAKAKGE